MTVLARLCLGATSLLIGGNLRAAPVPGARAQVLAPVHHPLALELPRLAVVTEEDDSGQTWRLTGELPASFAVARQDFRSALSRQGWTLRHSIPTATGASRTELQTWTKGKRKVLLLLSEEEPRLVAFSLGETDS